MKIKLFLFLCLLPSVSCAWERTFSLSEDAQKKADFYNKFVAAINLEKQAKYTEALPAFKELLTEKPQDATLILEYCFLVLDYSKEEFNFCKNKLENIENKTWQIYTLLGDYCLREGAISEALKYLEQAAKLNPENLELAFHYSGLLASKDQEKAVAFLKNLETEYPQAATFVNLKIADIYLKSNDEEKAISTLRSFLLRTQNKAEIYDALTRIYKAKKDKQALYNTYREMVQEGFATQQILEDLASDALAAQDDKQAEQYFTMLKNIDAKNPYAARYFAFHEQSAGRYESALKYLKQSRDFDENPALQIKAGYYLSMLSKQEELLNLMANAYTKFHGNQEIAYYYALALIDAKKYKQAAKVFDNALKAAPENEPILFNYATLSYQQKNYKKMEELLRRLLKINPQNAEAANFLGYYFVDKNRKKNWPEGYNLITLALQLKPQEVAYQDSLAWYYFKTGEYEKAANILFSLPDTDDEEICFHKAQVSFALNDYDNAVLYFEKSLKLNPKNKQSKKGLAKAKKKKAKIEKEQSK